MLGIERKLSLGSFPNVSLQRARRARDVAKAEIDPVEEKRSDYLDHLQVDGTIIKGK